MLFRLRFSICLSFFILSNIDPWCKSYFLCCKIGALVDFHLRLKGHIKLNPFRPLGLWCPDQGYVDTWTHVNGD